MLKMMKKRLKLQTVLPNYLSASRNSRKTLGARSCRFVYIKHWRPTEEDHCFLPMAALRVILRWRHWLWSLGVLLQKKNFSCVFSVHSSLFWVTTYTRPVLRPSWSCRWHSYFVWRNRVKVSCREPAILNFSHDFIRLLQENDGTICDISYSHGGYYQDVTPYNLVGREPKSKQGLLVAYYFLVCLLVLLFDTEDGGSPFLRKIGKALRDYTLSYLRRECIWTGWIMPHSWSQQLPSIYFPCNYSQIFLLLLVACSPLLKYQYLDEQ
jgi:hypothetical protein